MSRLNKIDCFPNNILLNNFNCNFRKSIWFSPKQKWTSDNFVPILSEIAFENARKSPSNINDNVPHVA